MSRTSDSTRITVVTHETDGRGPLASLWITAERCRARGVDLRFVQTGRLATFAAVVTGDRVLFDSVAAFRHGYGALLYLAARLVRKRTAVYWHKTDWALERARANPQRLAPMRRLRSWVVRHALGNAALMHLHVCAYGRQMLQDRYGLPAEAVRVVNNCSDSARFADLEVPRVHRPGLFVGVGMAQERKGTDIFLEVARRLAPQRPEAEFVWLGLFSTGAYTQAALTRQLREHGLEERVRFTGEVENPCGLMADAEAVLVPSRDDPLPKSAQEALALGRKVVAFDVGGLREILDDLGHLLPRGDVEGYTAAVRDHHATDFDAQTQRRRRARFDARFSPAAFTEQFVAAVAWWGSRSG
jgi:glycosyltransferase involved in cell wall biosynthesis